MKTITIHLDDAEVARFREMKKATQLTWTEILFMPLKQWEAKNA